MNDAPTAISHLKAKCRFHNNSSRGWRWRNPGLLLRDLSQHKVRFGLTALSMVIGIAALILVVTIGLSGRQYVLNQIPSHRREHDFRRVLLTRSPMGTFDPLTVDDVRVIPQFPALSGPSAQRRASASATEKAAGHPSYSGAFPAYKIVRNSASSLWALFRRTNEQASQQSRRSHRKSWRRSFIGSTEAGVGKETKSSAFSRSSEHSKKRTNVRQSEVEDTLS